MKSDAHYVHSCELKNHLFFSGFPALACLQKSHYISPPFPVQCATISKGLCCDSTKQTDIISQTGAEHLRGSKLSHTAILLDFLSLNKPFALSKGRHSSRMLHKSRFANRSEATAFVWRCVNGAAIQLL